MSWPLHCRGERVLIEQVALDQAVLPRCRALSTKEALSSGEVVERGDSWPRVEHRSASVLPMNPPLP